MGVLGERLGIARQRLGLTQEDVAGQIDGLSAAALSNYERGVRDPDTSVVARLAGLYGVSTDFLLGRTDDPSPKQSAYMPSWVSKLPPDMQEFVKEESQHGWPFLRLARGLKMQDLTKKELIAIVETWQDAKREHDKKAR